MTVAVEPHVVHAQAAAVGFHEGDGAADMVIVDVRQDEQLDLAISSGELRDLFQQLRGRAARTAVNEDAGRSPDIGPVFEPQAVAPLGRQQLDVHEGLPGWSPRWRGAESVVRRGWCRVWWCH